MPAFWNGKKPKAQTLPLGLKGLVVAPFIATVWVCQTTSLFQPGTKGISSDQISGYFDMSNRYVPLCNRSCSWDDHPADNNSNSLASRIQMLPLLSSGQVLAIKPPTADATHHFASTLSSCPSNTLSSSIDLAYSLAARKVQFTYA